MTHCMCKNPWLPNPPPPKQRVVYEIYIEICNDLFGEGKHRKETSTYLQLNDVCHNLNMYWARVSITAQALSPKDKIPVPIEVHLIRFPD